MKTSLHQNEEDEEFALGSLAPEHVEYVESTIRELGKHICELDRQEKE